MESNAVDVPGVTPTVEPWYTRLWNATAGAVSAFFQGAAEKVAQVTEGAGEAVGTTAGKTVAGLVKPNIPWIILLLVGIGVALRVANVQSKISLAK